jgi:hypothetical protein
MPQRRSPEGRDFKLRVVVGCKGDRVWLRVFYLLGGVYVLIYRLGKAPNATYKLRLQQTWSLSQFHLQSTSSDDARLLQ